MSKIEWTEKSWNPVRGCSRVSPGCDNCYAMGQAHRFNTPAPKSPYHGLTTKRGGKVDWTGVARVVPELLSVPLKRRTSTTYFVNSMSDLFHHSVTNEEIAAIFGIMAECPQHTFQVLTKRPERMREWFEWIAAAPVSRGGPTVNAARGCLWYAWNCLDDLRVYDPERPWIWPLPNVWIGVSAEDQQRADDRIPHLLETPAAVRFVSAEPLLGPIDLTSLLVGGCGDCDRCIGLPGMPADPRQCHSPERITALHPEGLSWVIVGGESGPGVRPMDIAWARSILRHCREAGVAAFMKQRGSLWYDSERSEGMRGSCVVAVPHGPGEWRWVEQRDRKGGDMSEWSEDLRVREMPR